MISFLTTDQLHDELRERVPPATSAVRAAFFAVRHRPQNPRNPAHAILTDLIAAAARGVRVDLLLPDSRYNKPNRATEPYLVRAGLHVRTVRPPLKMHAKLIIIDRAHLYVSSANLSRRAFVSNIEATLYTDDPAAICAALRAFSEWWHAARPLEGGQP